ncbi:MULTISPECIES: SdpI family protein [Vagococcus]|uniref:SdpI/YhfL protein family n=1 Tax=Vagococcus fluvialis bH819 TaxID=1255619 RepID=A0A1X6WRU5_9ENTE|nr:MULTISPECIES: SdpI family protein [Vagococcus]SLM86376.1 hypothetical protein FM121_09815 [Vagococcus fluvialis bH819]HCM89030.1 hypothetical protein [Vagococcus sp.]
MVLLLMSLFLYLFSPPLYEYPQKINRFEGYRSKKAMKNQENWEKAQKLMITAYKKARKALLVLGILLIITEYLLFFVFHIDVLFLLIMLEGFIVIGTCLYVHLYVEKRI